MTTVTAKWDLALMSGSNVVTLNARTTKCLSVLLTEIHREIPKMGIMFRREAAELLAKGILPDEMDQCVVDLAKEYLHVLDRLNKFHIIGTDGCKDCESGRVSIWKKYDYCQECLNGKQ